MDRKEDDDKIERITKLLEKGGTMLATHHDCGAPMFRYQGKIVCPVCDFEKKEQSKEAEKTKIGAQQILRSQQAKEPESENVTSKLQKTDSYAISLIITNKIQHIVSGLENETDLGRVRDKMECIELGIKILKLLKDKD